MTGFVPAFEWQRVMVQPWTEDFMVSFWIVVMGFFVAATCGLVGTYLLLRRMALVGDAISHSILFGLVVAFMIFRSGGTTVMFVAAVATGLLTVGIIEFIHRQSRVKTDAAICIAFTTLFAAGVVLLSLAEMKGPVHLDAECVLYGEIAFVPLDPAVEIFGLTLGPAPVVRIAGVLVGLLVLVAVFYKELLVTSFDPALARSLGLRTGIWHYGLMAVLSIVIVSVFEAVGAILAVAMLVVPPMFAAQLSDRLPVRFVLVFLHAALSSLLGYQVSVWLNCSPAGAMVVVGALLFLLAWAVTRPRRAVLPDPTVHA
jgi:ABC-type Mn2+/Zn2+ transport systems, permease components